MKIIKSEDFKVNSWSGGTTSEIYIFPEDAEFKKGDYQLRISKATIESESSTFTKLPGVERILTVLEGELTLKHEGHHSIKLKPYDQDSFSGNWVTKSEGKAVDFNVMTKGNAKVIVKSYSLNKELTLEEFDFNDLSLLFVINGKAMVNNVQINESEAIVFKNELNKIQIEGKTNIIFVSVRF